MSKIDEKIGEVIEKLAKLAETHGDSAVSLAVEVMRWQAITFIAAGFLCLVTSLVAYKLGRWFVRKEDALGDKAWRDVFPYAGPAVLSVIASVTTGSAAFIILVHLWSWASIFNPKMALAYKIMKAAGL